MPAASTGHSLSTPKLVALAVPFPGVIGAIQGSVPNIRSTAAFLTITQYLKTGDELTTQIGKEVRVDAASSYASGYMTVMLISAAAGDSSADSSSSGQAPTSPSNPSKE